jgi:hypothetical protein
MNVSERNRAGRALALAAALGGLLLTGCAESAYLYRPAGQAAATVGGVPAASYDIPPGQAAGTVRVASLGVTELAIDDASVPVVRARMTVTNSSDDAGWELDTSDVQADFGAGKQRPAFANAAGSELPLITIPRGQERTVDLFYRLPEATPDADSLPAFELDWKVKTGTVEVAGSTSFERTEVDDSVATGAPVAVMYAPYWWYDPLFYSRPMYIGAPWGERPWYHGTIYAPFDGRSGSAHPHGVHYGVPHHMPATPHIGLHRMGGGGGRRH